MAALWAGRRGGTCCRNCRRNHCLFHCWPSRVNHRVHRWSNSRCKHRPHREQDQRSRRDLLTLVEVLKPSLTDDEIRYAVKKLGREPNEVEWSMLEAEWSEHCSYKSSKPLLRLLPSKGSRVLVGPGFDAGVVDVGNGWVVTLHIESHNHPSAIDPYGGAATGVGGVVRDILSLGTRPIALLDPLRFGSLESLRTCWLFDNVVRGIADYGNCIGVPTVGGEVEFDSSFERNCLVDVVCVGLGRKDKLILGEARNAGDLVYLVGGRTGRDGIR